eukprot:1162124-Pelagomonas_calceolata.AAC.1
MLASYSDATMPRGTNLPLRFSFCENERALLNAASSGLSSSMKRLKTSTRGMLKSLQPRGTQASHRVPAVQRCTDKSHSMSTSTPQPGECRSPCDQEARRQAIEYQQFRGALASRTA